MTAKVKPIPNSDSWYRQWRYEWGFRLSLAAYFGGIYGEYEPFIKGKKHCVVLNEFQRY